MTDFNFLRIKWPKLAAIAADAGRLVEVSPASAISGMQNFCEWAADIALDYYEINTQTGITQQEKLDTLKATGHVPGDILERFHDIMMSGGRRLYRENEDVEEARRCIDDVYEIGRWLNKEADRVGWPPKTDYYNPVMSSMGVPGETGSFTTGRIGTLLNNYKNLLIMAAAVIVVIVAAVLLINTVYKNAEKNTNKDLPTLTPTPTVEVSATPTTTAADDATPTPPPEQATFLDQLTPTNTHKDWFFPTKWHFQKSGDVTFTIGDKQYFNGYGMFVPYSKISGSTGSGSMTFKLNGAYQKLRFDLGIDAGLQYGTGYGKYRIVIKADSKQIYTTDPQNYDFTDLGKELDVTGCKTLTITLTEWKGTKKSTLNVVLGNIRVVKVGAGAEPTDTSGADEGGDASPDASASPSPSPSPSASASASASSTDPPG